MMDNEGTVAVVRGLPGAGLTVTLVDSGRQYTLLPENFTHPISNPRPQECPTTASQCASYVERRESGVQATDGRYASTYKMMHCHMTPTSPPEQVTEFPPQRAELCPGHGNFEVGGTGSGESFCHATRYNGYRDGTSCPDRVYKNSKNRSSPSRDIDSDQSIFCLERSSSRNTAVKSARDYQPEVHLNSKRLEESPTRERSRNTRSRDSNAIESWKMSPFSKANDVRYLKEVSRKVREGKQTRVQDSHQPERLNPKEKCDSANHNRSKPAAQLSTNSVNMEIQAAVQMISREVVTAPRIVPSLRTIAVPLTPTPSKITNGADSESHQFEQNSTDITNIVENTVTLSDMTVQTVISNTAMKNKRKNKFPCKRRSMSKEEIINLGNRRSILSFHTSCCKARCINKTYRYNRSYRALLNLAKKGENYSNYDKAKRYAGTKTTFKCLSVSEICYERIARKRIINEDVIVKVLEDWVDLMPLKIKNPYEMQIVKDDVQQELFNLIKKSISYVQLNNSYKLDKLRCDIIEKLKRIPIDITSNKKLILQKLADNLLTKIEYSRHRKLNHYKVESNEANTKYTCVFQRYIAPTDNEIRKFICHELSVIEKVSDLNLKRNYKDVEDDLVEVAIIAVEVIRCGNENNIKKSVAELFSAYGLSKKLAISCANTLVKRLKDTFFCKIYPDRVKSETIIVLPNYQNVYHTANLPGSDFREKSITDNKITASPENYKNDLCTQIDEWLSTLHIQIPQAQDTKLRRVVVNDLAEDIVDRYKYLRLSPEQNISNETELEHLKYQIFKWIKKLVGEDNLEPLKHAAELMTRINKIPAPILSNTAHKSFKDGTAIDDINKHHGRCETMICDTNIVETNVTQDSENKSMNETQTPNLSIPEYKGNNTPVPTTNPCSNHTTVGNLKSTERLEADYEQFVNDWIQRIPIEIPSEGVIDIAEKARLGIYNGLWKIVSKLNCDPATYYNRFLYEDLLDDAIEELLDCLPQTIALQSRRHILKVEFIEKTVDINDKIKEIEESSFKNKLMKNLVTSLRKQGITDNRGDDATKLHEDLQITKIVEDYLLFARFRDEDQVKSEVYKKNLIKEVEAFVKDLKQNHSKQLKDIDVSSYKEDIVSILQKVPIPSEKTIKQEADEVLLGIEIEQWYSDLPIVPNDDYTEQYQRRRQRDILTKKIKQLEANDESSENALKTEVSRFLEKTPLKDGESLNINLMVDNLVNRLKKTICQAPESYEYFSKNIPLCSSLIATSTELKPHDDSMRNVTQVSQCGNACQQTRNMAASNNQNHVVIREPPSYRVFDEERPISSSFKEPTNRQGPTRKEHLSMLSLPPYASSIPDDETNTQRKDRNYYQRALAKDNNAEPFTPSAGTTTKIKNDKGVLGISQVAGPSGYTPSSEDTLNYPDQAQHPRPFPLSSLEDHFVDEEPSQEPSLNKHSIECQTEKAHFLNPFPNEINYSREGKVCKAINTPDFEDNDPIFSSTPQQTKSPSIPSVPSKKRANLAIDGKNNARRRLDLDDTDDDDVPCRCIEKFWRKRQNSKHYPCEDFDRYPPYLPIFFPYPYPSHH